MRHLNLIAATILLSLGYSAAQAQLRSGVSVVGVGGRVCDRAAPEAVLDGAAPEAVLDGAAPGAKPSGPPSAAAAPQAAHPVYLMRHLPAASGSPDPALTPEGAEGARRLPIHFADAGLKAIFVTDTRRSRETAGPLAARLGLTPVVYEPRSPGSLRAQAVAASGPVLIIGHSNTVPDLVRRFGGDSIAPLGEKDFGVVWCVDGPGPSRRLKIEGVGRAAPAR